MAGNRGSMLLMIGMLMASAFTSASATCLSRRHLSQYDPMNDPKWPNRYANQDPSNATTFGAWQPARATAAYNHDGMDINQAACAFGTIDPNSWGGQGLQVAAISDVNPEYTSSCGRCYEFQCGNRDFSDAYGSTLYRSSACASTSGSMVIKIIDSCPCDYPSNSYSNKRWCCGDMTHFDLSYWAFQKFANPSLGVIAINYRRVPCTYQPEHSLGPIGYPSGWPDSSWYPTTYGDQAVFPSSADQPLPSPSPSPAPTPDASASAAASASAGSTTASASASTSGASATAASTGSGQQPAAWPTQLPTSAPTPDSQPTSSPPPPPPPASEQSPSWSSPSPPPPPPPADQHSWTSSPDWSSPTASPSPSWSSPSQSPEWLSPQDPAASSPSASSGGSPGQQSLSCASGDASCSASSSFQSASASSSTSTLTGSTSTSSAMASPSSPSPSSSSSSVSTPYFGRRRMASIAPADTSLYQVVSSSDAAE